MANDKLEARVPDELVVVVPEQCHSVEASKENKKKKKKKKNTGSPTKVEDDLYLEDLETSGKLTDEPEEGVGLGGTVDKEEEITVVESAAAKKKKRKEKVKAKKAEAAAAVGAKDEEFSKPAAERKEPKAKGKEGRGLKQIREALARQKEVEERAKREEEERLRIEEEERRREEELERQRQEAKQRKKEKLLQKKKEGKLLTGKQKEEARRLEAQRKQILDHAAAAGILAAVPSSDTAGPVKRPVYGKKKLKHEKTQKDTPELEQVESLESVEKDSTEAASETDEWDDQSCCSGDENPALPADSLDVGNHVVVEEKKTENTVFSPAPPQSDENFLRSPIYCIMGHVDTGKTKLLDCIRGTKVQEGEAGGITQQIGATYIPVENIRERTRLLKADAKLKVPGLLVIDTPGHESFSSLRSRGSSLCDVAILLVDIMHGLEPQTIESIKLLKLRNTEFIVALNKVDRLYGWKSSPNAPICAAMKQQSKDVKNEFNMRLTQVITQFKEQGLNTALYYNKNTLGGDTYNIVPTSATTGEGIADLLLLLVQWAQRTMVEKLTFSNEVQCTVLEVKVVEGHGTTIDVILVNGVLHEGDQIVVCSIQGPIVTTVRALLTPHPLKELRVKGSYLHHKEIKAAQCIKITAQGLEHAIAGTDLYVVRPQDDVEAIKEAAREEMESVMNRFEKSSEGVMVQASTLGSLEALLDFLKSPEVNIPVSNVNIGPVHKKDVMKASVMLEKRKEFATILAFDIKVTPEARQLSDELGVKIFAADIIYHLFDQFKAYAENLKDQKKKEASDEAVFPCALNILQCFNASDPIIMGVEVLNGYAKVGTPLCTRRNGNIVDIGRITSIKHNDNPVDFATKGQAVSIKIVGTNPEEQQLQFGRHFKIDDELLSHLTRSSIDALKAFHRDIVKEHLVLIKLLKSIFKIP